MRSLLVLVVALGSLMTTAATVFAQEPARLALLIGNQGYTAKVGPLKNPHNDVRLIEASLKRIGFKVTVLEDAGYRAMDSALKRYVTQVRRAGRGALSFFYYSGHGVANPETHINYLIPIDVADANDDNLWYNSFQQNVVIDLLSKQAPNATHYVVFDACRNEFNISGAAAKALGSDKGFVPVNDNSGLLIAYATAPQKTASDVGVGGGPYAKALAEELVKPGIESVTMFRNVQIRVKQAIGQDPWLSFPSLPPVYLAGKAETAALKPAPAQPAASPRLSEAAEAWDRTKDATSIAVLEVYAARFMDTFYADLARARIEELKNQRVAVAVPPNRPSPTPASCDGVEVLAGNERKCLKPKDSFKDCPGCPEMVVVPAGSFMMGSAAGEAERFVSEGPLRRVTIAKPLAVGKFEVTFAEWDACVAGGGCKHNPDDEGWGRGRRPVINVSWDDATKEYQPWLSRTTGKSYRLLTEAEWEYAARAGTTTPFATGRMITTDQTNFNGNSTYNGSAKGQYRQRSIEVGAFAGNGFGLHDMHGNVWEWVEDCWHANYNDAPVDGSAWISSCSGTVRVLRGGSWVDIPWYLRSASRGGSSPDSRVNSLGFRVARTL